MRSSVLIAPRLIARSLPFRHVLLLPLLASACAGGRDVAPAPLPLLEPPPPAAPAVGLPEAQLTPPAGAEGAIRRIDRREQVPLAGPRVRAAPGDWMIRHGGLVAVVSASRGAVIDFGREGERDELDAIEPTVQIALDVAAEEVEQIEQVGEGGRALRVVRAVRGQPLKTVSWFYLARGALRIDSVAVGVAEAAAGAGAGADPGAGAGAAAARRLPALAVTLGELATWGNVKTWAEGVGFVDSWGTFTTGFVGRESFGVGYAACSMGGALRARFAPQSDFGYFQPAMTGEILAAVPYGGVSERRSIAVGAAGSLGDAAAVLPCVRGGGTRVVSIPLVAARGAYAEVNRCDAQGKAGRPFARFAAERAKGGADRRDLELPAGCFQVRLGAPGYAPGAWAGADAIGKADRAALAPRAGKLRLRIVDNGQPSAGRAIVRGVDGTADPYWGDDAEEGLALNVAHVPRGEAEAPVPPGRYRVHVTRGFEFTAHEQEIEVAADGVAEVRADLTRVVDTKGWIAADLHLHAEPSPDAPSRLPERVRSLVAAGVEVGVATDHNAVTDYGPTIREMGLGGSVASVVGDEVTTRGPYFGHFNVFPLEAGSAPLGWVGVTPSEIFAEARRRKPYGDQTLVQVNHPRMGSIGYFEVLRMDGADVGGWMKQAPLADLGFDTLEVFNGAEAIHLGRVEAVMRDWYALLNAGFRVVATGNSDSHRVAFHEAGVPRNLVAVPDDAPGRFDERAFIAAIRAGRVTVSGGPLVRIQANGKGMGEEVAAGEVEIEVRVDAPPWVDVDQVELVRRGEVIKQWTLPLPEAGEEKGAKKKGGRVAAAQAATKAQGMPVSLKTREALKKGDWVIAIARGSRVMPHLVERVMPFGFTNPVFVR